MTPKYNTILFDADGTLLDFSKAEEAALQKPLLITSSHWTKLYALGTSKSIISSGQILNRA